MLPILSRRCDRAAIRAGITLVWRGCDETAEAALERFRSTHGRGARGSIVFVGWNPDAEPITVEEWVKRYGTAENPGKC